MLNRLLLSVFIVTTCCVPFGVVRADWLVRGGDIDWSMSVVEGWYGGSYNQIRERLEGGASVDKDPLVREVFKAMLEDARYADAILFHIEPELGGATRLKSRKVAGSVYAAAQKIGIEEYVRMIGQSLGQGKPPGSSFNSLGQESITLGGKRAYRVEYSTRLPNNDVSRDVIFLVTRQSDYHMLYLVVDERVYRPRMNELRRMLTTLQYHD